MIIQYIVGWSRLDRLTIYTELHGSARLYSAILNDHFARHRPMALVSGPRQVGKTTTVAR